MNRLSSFSAVAASLLLLAAAPTQAADVIVVHGINGTDLGLTEALPVDVAVDGGCALTDFQFGEFTNDPAVSLETGAHEVEVFLSDGACGGALVASGRVDLAFGETALVVAHLDEAGTISLSKFTANAGPLASDDLRVTVAHGAVAPAVDVGFQAGRRNRASVEDLANSESSFPLELAGGEYDIRIRFQSRQEPFRGSIRLDDVALGGNLVIVAVGSPANGTFAPLVVPILP